MLFRSPCGPINTIDRVFSDRQVQFRGMQLSMASDTYGDVDLVASPMRLSKSPVSYRHAPPALGRDSDDILRELGYADEQIARLRSQGAI